MKEKRTYILSMLLAMLLCGLTLTACADIYYEGYVTESTDLDALNANFSVVAPGLITGVWGNLSSASVAVLENQTVAPVPAVYKYKIQRDGAEDISGTYIEPISITALGVTTVQVWIVGSDGYESPKKEFQVCLDRQAPTKPVLEGNGSVWVADKVTVSVTPGVDTGSGVDKTQYMLSTVGAHGLTETEWMDLPGNTLDVFTEGETTVYVRTVDKANNTSDVASCVVKIDKTAPGLASAELTTEPAELGLTPWLAATSVSARIVAGSAGTGAPIASVTYVLTGATTGTGTITAANPSVLIENEGETTITVTTIDGAGHNSVAVIPIKIDRSAPTGLLSIETLYTNNSIPVVTDENIRVSTAAADAVSGVSRVQLSNDGISYIDVPKLGTVDWTLDEITAGGVRVLHCKVIDEANNEYHTTAMLEVDLLPETPGAIASTRSTARTRTTLTCPEVANNALGSYMWEVKYDTDPEYYLIDKTTVPTCAHILRSDATSLKFRVYTTNSNGIASLGYGYSDDIVLTYSAIPEAPTVDIDNEGSWTNNNTVTMIPGADADIGDTVSVYYTLNGANVQLASTLYTEALELINSGVTTITAMSVDSSDVRSAATTKTIKLDMLPPTQPVLALKTSAGAAHWSKTSAMLEVTPGVDTLSGVRGVYVDGVFYNKTEKFEILISESKDIRAYTVDNAGNRSADAQISLSIDNEAPKLTRITCGANTTTSRNHLAAWSSEAKADAAREFASAMDTAWPVPALCELTDVSGNWASGYAGSTVVYAWDTVNKLSVLASDGESGVAHCEYRVYNDADIAGEWKTSDGSIVVPYGKHRIGVRAVDNAGNTSEEVSFVVYVEQVLTSTIDMRSASAVGGGGASYTAIADAWVGQDANRYKVVIVGDRPDIQTYGGYVGVTDNVCCEFVATDVTGTEVPITIVYGSGAETSVSGSRVAVRLGYDALTDTTFRFVTDKAVLISYRVVVSYFSNNLMTTSGSIKIDAEKPTISKFELENSATVTKNRNIVIDTTVEDKVSGIETIELANEDMNYKLVGHSAVSQISWLLSEVDAEKTLHMRVTDKAGNVSTETLTLVYDKTPPTAVLELIDAPVDTAEVQFRLTLTDNMSGIVSDFKVRDSYMLSDGAVRGRGPFDYSLNLVGNPLNAVSLVSHNMGTGLVAKRVIAIVQDRAGNETTVTSEWLEYMSNFLSIDGAWITDIMRADRFNGERFDPVLIPTGTQQQITSGGNISFEVELNEIAH